MIGFDLFAQRINPLVRCFIAGIDPLVRCFITDFNQLECGLMIGFDLFAQRIKFCLEYRQSFFNTRIR